MATRAVNSQTTRIGESTPDLGTAVAAEKGSDQTIQFLQLDDSKNLKVNVATGTVSVSGAASATATTSQVADTASSTMLLAANSSRLGATIENDSTADLYVKLGTTASFTDYTVLVVQYAYYEVPYGYTGRIDGIWASDPNDGAARITELT